MSKQNKLSVIPDEVVTSKIYLIRGQKVILDINLAEFYSIETRILKQAVRRNRDRFPEDFMFELTEDEINILVSQNVIPSRKYLGGAVPFAFTESGVAMLSSILKSKRAIKTNIAIMRTFVMLRKMLYLRQEFGCKLDHIERKIAEHDNQILIIFEYLKQFEQAQYKELDQKSRKVIKGYRKGKI